MKNLTYKSIDVMKWTKDQVTNQPSQAQIDGILDAFYNTFGANLTHISLAIPLNTNAQFVTAGSTPSGETVELMYARWCTSIRARGWKVIHRGTLCGIEGLYGFTQEVGGARIAAGDATSAATDGATTHLGKVYDWLTANGEDCIATGDVLAFIPERTEGIFSDATAFLPDTGAGIQANYSAFFVDLQAVEVERMSALGITGVVTGYTSNNFTEINSGWIPAGLFTDAAVVAVDHYGSTHTPLELRTDLRAIQTAKALPLFHQEWADYWNGDLASEARLTYLRHIYDVLRELSDEKKLIGFNYWGGWVEAGGGAGEGILTDLGSNVYEVNEFGQLLAQYFAGTQATGLVFKSIDTMKLSRDKGVRVGVNELSNAEKIEHIEAIVRMIPDITHITVASYANNQIDFHPIWWVGEWFDAIHAAGKKVFFRPAWVGLTVTQAGTDKIIQSITDFGQYFQDGDYYDLAPESSPANGSWNAWAQDTWTEATAAFDVLGKDVNVDLWSVTDANVVFGKNITDETVALFNDRVCIDFYPLDAGTFRAKINNLIGQIKLIHANYPTADIYITETGYNNLTAVSDYDQLSLLRHLFTALSELWYVKGLNYWVSYGNSAFDKTYIFMNNSRVNGRPAIQALSDYYTHGTPSRRMPVV